MGKIKYILIGFLALIMVSCDGLFGVENNVGKPIKFGVAQHPKTRTEYSQEYDGRIEWSKGDEVSIYMTWDGDDYYGNPESANYNVSLTKNSDRLSYGKLSPSSGKSLKWHGYYKDGRAWEYVHTFYSSYPPRELIKDENNYKFWYDLPSNQDEITMDYAYMAACSNSRDRVKNDDGTVYLEYNPMITTLVVTIKNDTDKSIGNDDTKLTFASKALNVVGEYCVRSYYENAFSFGYFANNEKDSKSVQVTTGPIAAGSSVTKMFFIAPQEYNDLFYTFDDNIERPINNTLSPAYKYNITITASGNKPPTFKETIDNGEAQFLILWITNYLKDSAFNDFFGFDQNGDHRYGEFNDRFINNKYGDVWNGNIAEQFLDFFTEEQLNKLYGRLLTETKFETSNKQITCPIHKEFFSLFPNLEEIYIQTYSTVEIPELKKLKKVTFEYAKEVTISECNSLTSITLKNTPNLEKFTLSKCKSVTTFDMTTPSETWTPNAEYTFDTMENLSSVKLCSAAAVNVYDCDNLPNANISMKNPVDINRNRK